MTSSESDSTEAGGDFLDLDRYVTSRRKLAKERLVVDAGSAGVVAAPSVSHGTSSSASQDISSLSNAHHQRRKKDSGSEASARRRSCSVYYHKSRKPHSKYTERHNHPQTNQPERDNKSHTNYTNQHNHPSNCTHHSKRHKPHSNYTVPYNTTRAERHSKPHSEYPERRRKPHSNYTETQSKSHSDSERAAGDRPPTMSELCSNTGTYSSSTNPYIDQLCLEPKRLEASDLPSSSFQYAPTKSHPDPTPSLCALCRYYWRVTRRYLSPYTPMILR